MSDSVWEILTDPVSKIMMGETAEDQVQYQPRRAGMRGLC